MDALVFEVPVEKAGELRLSLPLANVGGTGRVTLRIPTKAIVKAGQPPDQTEE